MKNLATLLREQWEKLKCRVSGQPRYGEWNIVFPNGIIKRADTGFAANETGSGEGK